MTSQVIYSNGRVRLVLVTRLMLEVEGRVVQTFDPWQVDEAVAEVDRMAESDGCFAHASC
jgi:hypothetical protein